METESEFHRKLEPQIKGIKVYWKNADRHNTSIPLPGEFYKVVGIDGYVIRKRFLGESLNGNHEIIRLIEEPDAQVALMIDEEVLWGRFMPIAVTNEQVAIEHVVRLSTDDLLGTVGINLDTL